MAASPIRNAVVVAIMQVGVIVAGVLAAGVSYRWWTVAAPALPAPSSILLVMNYGIATLVVPPVWITSMLLLLRRPEVSDEAKGLAFVSGIVILGALVILVLYAVIGPWLMVGWPFGGGDDM